MTVSARHMSKCLLNKRATEGVDGQPAASSSSDSRVSPTSAREHVVAAARLWSLPWDPALGYGNPKREVRLDDLKSSVGTEAQHLIVFPQTFQC